MDVVQKFELAQTGQTSQSGYAQAYLYPTSDVNHRIQIWKLLLDSFLESIWMIERCLQSVNVR